jgi:uncharacterized protein
MRTITLEEHFSTSGAVRARSQPSSDNPMADFMRQLHERLLDVGSGRIAAMDKDGIDHQVLSLAVGGLNSFDAGFARETAEEANQIMITATREYPDRFSAFAALALQDPEHAAQVFESCVRTHGFKGALIDGTVGGSFLDHDKFRPIFEVANANDVPIYLHPAPPPSPVQQAYFDDLKPPLNFLLSTSAWGWHVETGLHVLRLIASGLFDIYPKLKIIIGHMGENLPFSIVRADSVLQRGGLKLKRSVQEYFLQNFWITTSGYFSVPPFLCARDVMGIDRVMLSIDYPFSDLRRGEEFLSAIAPHVSPEDLEKVAWRNAATLLKIGQS